MSLQYIVQAFAQGKRGRVCVMFNTELCELTLGDEEMLDFGLRILDASMEAERLVEASTGLVLPAKY